MPDWAWLHAELRRPGITLALIWQEYRLAPPQGFEYSWFCERYPLCAAKVGWLCAKSTVRAKS